MFIGKFGHLTSTGSTLHKSFFYQERFVNFLNGSRIFSQSRGNGSDTYRTTFKFFYNGAKYLVVYLIVKVPVIPTGSIGVDLALGIGGIPKGRVTEIYGPELPGRHAVSVSSVLWGAATGNCSVRKSTEW